MARLCLLAASGAAAAELPGFLISTACATERRSSALEQLATLQRRPQLRTFQRDTELGARGCYSSHLAVYREALESQLPFAMIFEDNLQVTVDQAEARDLLAKAEDFCLEEQPQVLHLSLVHSAASLRLTRHKGLVRVERTSPDWYGPVFIEQPPGLGTTGYIICRQAMERLVELDRVQGYQQPIDELLAAQFPETFALFPAVLHRGPAQSLINPDQALFRSVMYDQRVVKNLAPWNPRSADSAGRASDCPVLV
ncbi:unnamed protein product [Effrenium voratum]|uniref:Glycosyl transferase family 25 domain-containing protein n=1 Tax=Effrenium voratum TaxID=2562239 RepID=A0AA36MWY3_9DINO|nr:unnamed protein product [Effrenium voratum]